MTAQSLKTAFYATKEERDAWEVENAKNDLVGAYKRLKELAPDQVKGFTLDLVDHL